MVLFFLTRLAVFLEGRKPIRDCIILDCCCSGQERGGVGIKLPSINLWPWSSLTISQRRQGTQEPRWGIFSVFCSALSSQWFRYKKPAVFTKKTTAKGVFTKKPTGLEKKPFGPKYPPKFVNSNYQKYKNKPKLPANKVRLAPIPDLRPTSIDRIDILRWKIIPSWTVWKNNF